MRQKVEIRKFFYDSPRAKVHVYSEAKDAGLCGSHLPDHLSDTSRVTVSYDEIMSPQFAVAHIDCKRCVKQLRKWADFFFG